MTVEGRGSQQLMTVGGGDKVLWSKQVKVRKGEEGRGGKGGGEYYRTGFIMNLTK